MKKTKIEKIDKHSANETGVIKVINELIDVLNSHLKWHKEQKKGITAEKVWDSFKAHLDWHEEALTKKVLEHFNEIKDEPKQECTCREPKPYGRGDTMCWHCGKRINPLTNTKEIDEEDITWKPEGYWKNPDPTNTKEKCNCHYQCGCDKGECNCSTLYPKEKVKEFCKCKKPQGCKFLDENNEYDCIRCHDYGLPLPTNTKEKLQGQIENIISEFYFIHCQPTQRPEFKTFDEAESWTKKHEFRIKLLVERTVEELLALLVK